jgi:hypothetical protein
MKNQQTELTETSPEQRMNTRKNKLLKTSLILGITVTVVTGWIMIPTNPGRISNVSEIQAQIKYQNELIKEQEEFQQKLDAARLETEKKSAVMLKKLE